MASLFFFFFTFLLQLADPGWHRHQQTVRVWHSTSPGGPLWEDRGSAAPAGRKSVCRFSLSASSSVHTLISQKAAIVQAPPTFHPPSNLWEPDRFTPRHLARVPSSCVMLKPVGRLLVCWIGSRLAVYCYCSSCRATLKDPVPTLVSVSPFSMNFNVVPKTQRRTCLSRARVQPAHAHWRVQNTHGRAPTLNVWHSKIHYRLSVLLSAASFLYLSSPNAEWDQRRGEKHPEPNRPGHCEPVHHHASQPRDQTTAER